MSIEAAYRHCEQVTSTQARNFSYGIRLLPPVKRRALSAVYAYARRIDDIGDGDLPAQRKLELLARERHAVTHIERDSPDPVLTALGDAARRCPIPLDAFTELIEGCEDDVRGQEYDDFEALEHYCRCVAGSIGRLSLGVFGTSEVRTAAPLADALGVALQLTNILRDIREDREMGRVYLPREDRERFGCPLVAGDGSDLLELPGPFVALVSFEAARAKIWYAEGLRLLPYLDRRSTACCAAMASIYHRLLDRIADDPLAPARGRVSLPGREKAVVAARALVGAGS